MDRVEFDGTTLPWLDRPYAAIDEYVTGLDLPGADAEVLRDRLIHWMRFGYLVLPGLVEQELVDAYLADIDELVRHPERCAVDVLIEGNGGAVPAREVDFDRLSTYHFRICDFHNSSVAAKLLALHPAIVEMLEHIFRAPVVAMQTLTFLYGSEQHLHQDFAYVVSGIPSHLAATWIALEDVHPDAGPLGYRPGSHTIPKFDFGNGMLLTAESTRGELEFRDHLEAAAGARGFDEVVFAPKKGDVFFWHSALAHRGTAVNTPGLSRRSLVTHYSTVDAYPHDRRAPAQTPVVQRVGQGIVYADPRRPADENQVTVGLDLLRRGHPETIPSGMTLVNMSMPGTD